MMLMSLYLRNQKRLEATDSGNEDGKESNEADYDEDQLEKEKEEETGVPTEATTNQTF
jgi:hypothetical protein